MPKKVLSYSLWGNKPKYTFGAIANASDAKHIYPDFEVRFYVDSSVPEPVIQRLLGLNAKVFKIDLGSNSSWDGLFWRYLPSIEQGVEVLISRDTDSRLSEREAASVEDWLNSDAALHIMRDHPGHYMPILGGMCGFRHRSLAKLAALLPGVLGGSKSHYYNSDQRYLNMWMLEFLDDDSFVNDEIFERKIFRVKRNELSYVGESIDENGESNMEHREILRRWLSFKELCPTARLNRLDVTSD